MLNHVAYCLNQIRELAGHPNKEEVRTMYQEFCPDVEAVFKLNSSCRFKPPVFDLGIGSRRPISALRHLYSWSTNYILDSGMNWSNVDRVMISKRVWFVPLIVQIESQHLSFRNPAPQNYQNQNDRKDPSLLYQSHPLSTGFQAPATQVCGTFSRRPAHHVRHPLCSMFLDLFD